MPVSTVNISFQDELLSLIDETARDESRSRSELLREAVRMYIERKRRWKDIFSYGDALSQERGITEEEVVAAVRSQRG